MIFWSKYINIIGSLAFILFGLFLLVDFAYNWAELCLQKISDGERGRLYEIALVGSTAIMYASTIVMTILMYIFFARSGCVKNQLFITLNLIASIAVMVVSVHPRVQELNATSGISQAATVSLYATYLILSSLVNQPSSPQCNPLAKSSQRVVTIIGTLITFAAIAYSTTKAATQPAAIQLDDDVLASLDAADSRANRTQLRREALQAAVNSGSLPESALEDAVDFADETSSPGKDDEKENVQYNYTLFHVVFFLATCYVASLLTNWNTLTIKDTDTEMFVVIGRSSAAVWVKVISSWICYALYLWSCIAPVMFPDRFTN